MGVDFITCSKCRATFPDCGPHDQCEKHSLCPRCMPFREGSVSDDDHHDSDGYLLAEFCPVCATGGTELERLRKERDSLRAKLEACEGERDRAKMLKYPVDNDKICELESELSQAHSLLRRIVERWDAPMSISGSEEMQAAVNEARKAIE